VAIVFKSAVSQRTLCKERKGPPHTTDGPDRDAAHQTCPYSKATRGNIDAVINLV
jgi:organic hydroperoxide reductase OsmC/OhrA